MNRREVMGVLGGCVAWPFAIRAQQPALPVIGFLDTASPGPLAHFLTAFRQGLREVGFVEGRDVAIEYRWGENHYDRLPALATDLVQRQVAVIVAINVPSVLAAQAATKSIPIIFGIGQDPIALGLVASLNRPSGNITGYSDQNLTIVKRVQLLHELVPETKLIALLSNDANQTNFDRESRQVQTAVSTLGLNLLILNASSPNDLEAVFVTMAQQRVGALIVGSDPLFVAHRDGLVKLAARHAIPASYYRRDFAVAGGLMSYGSSLVEGYHQVGLFAGRVLKGEKPADMPVQQPIKFEFVINLNAAKALRLTIPPLLFATADEVIE
jgi:putative tryptophan/tyrosine transport system substrate-binding protein